MKKLVSALFYSTAVIALPFPALAQDQADSPSPSGTQDQAQKIDPDAPPVIVVTARKRSESLLDVPVTMTALSAEALNSYATHDLKTLSSRVPGFVVGESIAANGVQVSMRGIGTTVNNATVDQSVSLNIDGLQLSQGLAYQVGMFDLEQAEVLKGPQALFFGKNSPAGVVSLRSKDPTDEFELSFKAGYEFEAEQMIAEGVISGPVTDTLGARLAVRYSDQNGFFYNNASAIPGLGGRDPAIRDVTPTKNLIMRGTLVFEPSPQYSARLKVAYDELNMDGYTPASQQGFCPDGTGPVAPVNIPFLQGENCVLDREINVAWPDPSAFPGISNNGDLFMDQNQLLASLEQNFYLTDDITLTSVSAYYEIEQTYLFPGSTIPATVALVADSQFIADQFTQELRLTTNFNSPLNFMVGGFFQDGQQSPKVRLGGNTALRLPAILQEFDSFVEIESISAFGQVLWDIAPKLELTAGARWTEEERKHRQINDLARLGPVGPSNLLVPRIKSDNISPEVTLTYRPTNDVSIYGAYRTGYKSGSFNAVIFASPTTNASFGDESAEGGEIGVKAILFDRQLNFNAAIYSYDYSDLQVGANEIDGQTGALVLRTLNAASASVDGVEFDASFSPYSIPGLTVYGAANFNKARYSSFPNAPCGNGQSAPQGCDQLLNPATGRFTSQDLTGEPLVRAPDWIAMAGFTYDFPISEKLELQTGSYVDYSSGFSTNLTNREGYFQEAFAKLSANIALRDEDAGWEVALIGNNLTNKITHANSFNSNSQNGIVFGGQIQGGPNVGPAGNDEATMVANRGREVLLRLSWKFGGR